MEGVAEVEDTQGAPGCGGHFPGPWISLGDGTLHRARARRRGPPGRKASFTIPMGFIPLWTPCPETQALVDFGYSIH